MFLDGNGKPREVTPENLHEYPYHLHGVMLLTSADYEVYIPPRWHGTIYSTEHILESYKNRFKPDSTSLTFHALEAYEPELICCERCVVEISALPAGVSLNKGTQIVVFLVKRYEINMLITKELGNQTTFFPYIHCYHVRIMKEGIDELYLDGKIYEPEREPYQIQTVNNLMRKLRPVQVKSLTGNPLPPYLYKMCRKVDQISAMQ